jgi:hypothetical protein
MWGFTGEFYGSAYIGGIILKFQAKITRHYTRTYCYGGISIPHPIYKIWDRSGYTHVHAEIDENTHTVTLTPFKKEARDVHN